MNKLYIAGVLALAAGTGTLTMPAQADMRHEHHLENAADRIERAFHNDRWLSKYNLDADTVGNRIELRGTVHSERSRQHAITVAQDAAPRAIIDAHRLWVRR